MAINEPELTPLDLSPNWFALAYCILTNYNPEKVLDRALMKFKLSGAVKPAITHPREPVSATAILSIIRGRKP